MIKFIKKQNFKIKSIENSFKLSVSSSFKWLYIFDNNDERIQLEILILKIEILIS